MNLKPKLGSTAVIVGVYEMSWCIVRWYIDSRLYLEHRKSIDGGKNKCCAHQHEFEELIFFRIFCLPYYNAPLTWSLLNFHSLQFRDISLMVSQITDNWTVWLTACPGQHHRHYQSHTLLTLREGNHQRFPSLTASLADKLFRVIMTCCLNPY